MEDLYLDEVVGELESSVVLVMVPFWVGTLDEFSSEMTAEAMDRAGRHPVLA